MGDDLFFEYGTDEHLRLLLRLDRGQHAERAIKMAINPDDKVFDAGTGSGLLSYFALRHGASSVVAIDNANLDLAKAIASQNGLLEKIDFLNCDLLSDDTLPDLEADFSLMIGFMFTNHILRDEERIKRISFLANRYGNSGYRIVPSHVRYTAKIVEWPSMDILVHRQDIASASKSLASCYGFDFSPLTDKALTEIPFQVACPNYHRHYKWQPGEAMAAARFDRGAFRTLAEPIEFVNIDLISAHQKTYLYPESFKIRPTVAGKADGVIWQQELLYNELVIWTTETYSPFIKPEFITSKQEVTVETSSEWRDDHYLRLRV